MVSQWCEAMQVNSTESLTAQQDSILVAGESSDYPLTLLPFCSCTFTLHLKQCRYRVAQMQALDSQHFFALYRFMYFICRHKNKRFISMESVSYTHLTLPTKRIV